MADKPGFLDSLFDVNGDGKVDDIDFMDDYAIYRMMREDEDAEEEYPEVRNQAFANKIGSLGSSAWERAEARVDTEAQ